VFAVPRDQPTVGRVAPLPFRDLCLASNPEAYGTPRDLRDFVASAEHWRARAQQRRDLVKKENTRSLPKKYSLDLAISSHPAVGTSTSGCYFRGTTRASSLDTSRVPAFAAVCDEPPRQRGVSA